MKSFIRTIITILLIFSVQAFSYGENYLVAIVGTGRCGTKYISSLLCNLGLDVPHEKIGKDGIVSAYLIGKKNTYSQNGYRTGHDLTFTHVFHQVRHPLKVISSFYDLLKDNVEFWEFVNDEIEEFNSNDAAIVKVTKYWYYWNLKAEKMAQLTYKIEEIDNVFAELCMQLSLDVNWEVLNRVPKDTNHWSEVKKLTWVELSQLLEAEGETDLFKNIQQLATKYGYSVIDE